jgi:hypothetical protein
MIVESLTASPQSGNKNVVVGLKIDAFTQEPAEPFAAGPVAESADETAEGAAQ